MAKTPVSRGRNTGGGGFQGMKEENVILHDFCRLAMNIPILHAQVRMGYYV